MAHLQLLQAQQRHLPAAGLWPENWDFSNYEQGWTALNQPFHVYLINSMIVVVLSIVGNIFSCALAAYAFARMEFTGRKLFFTLMLGTLMLPGHVLLVPQYIIFSRGWLDTYLPLIVPNFMATNAFFIFLMVQFMKALPKELDDAAQIDGCGPFRTFLKVIMPLCVPAMATTAIFTFISTWNEFFGPCSTSRTGPVHRSTGTAGLYGLRRPKHVGAHVRYVRGVHRPDHRFLHRRPEVPHQRHCHHGTEITPPLLRTHR